MGVSIRWSTVRELVRRGLFVSILPFNFIYTYLTASALLMIVPGLIGGLTYGFAVVALVLVMREGAYRNKLIALTLASFLYILVVVVYHRMFSEVIDQTVDSELFAENIEILVRNLIYLSLGLLLGHEIAGLRRLLTICWLGMLVTCVSNSDTAAVTLRMPDGEDVAGLYLFLGDTFAVTSIVLLAALRGTLSRLGVALATVLALYAIGSRTSLYAFVSILPLAAAFVLNDSKAVERKGALAIALMSLAISAFALIVSNASSLSVRMVRLIAYGEDSSWAFRQWQLEEGLSVIRENPLVGAYGSDYLLLGRFGDYIHSYLEIWRQFGFIPFFLVISAILVAGTRIARSLHRSQFTEYARAASMLMLFCLIEIAFSRTWGSAYVFIAVGMAASKALVERKEGVP